MNQEPIYVQHIHRCQFSVVKETDIAAEDLHTLKARLTVYDDDTKKTTECFYKDEKGFYYFPRNAVVSDSVKETHPEPKRISEGAKFLGSLREEQKAPFEEGFDTDTLLLAPCGHGKTVMAAKRIVELGVRTIVVVPTTYLMRQWYESLTAFTEGLIITKAVPSKFFGAEKFDVLIITMDLLTERNFPPSFYTRVGHIVFDECHRLGAPTYHPILNQFNCRYRLGLTATMRRQDGMDTVLVADFGKAVRKVQYSLPKAFVYALKTGEECKIKQEALYINNLTKKSARTKLFVNTAVKAVKEGRRVLFLSKRKEILFDIEQMLHKEGVTDTVVLVESTNNEGLQQKIVSTPFSVILGIRQIAEYGFDCQFIDTLIMFHPVSDPEQAVGRVTRRYKDKKYPLVIFPLDEKHTEDEEEEYTSGSGWRKAVKLKKKVSLGRKKLNAAKRRHVMPNGDFVTVVNDYEEIPNSVRSKAYPC